MTRLRQLRPAEIAERREDIEAALRAVLAYSSGYTDEWVFRNLDTGVILLLEVLRGGKVGGYVLAQVDTHSDIRVLYLFGVYGTPGAKLDYPALRAALEALARMKGCTHIRAKSPRRGWERIAEALGFEPIATEYERQVAA